VIQSASEVIMKSTFHAEPFTNEIGQVINPGDRVAYVTHGYSVHVGKGVYAGVLRDSDGNHYGTRVTGIKTKQSFPTGKMKKITSTKWDYALKKSVPYTWEYEERELRDVEPYGSTCLQRHRVFKIEG
jgi:hypothetical protein